MRAAGSPTTSSIAYTRLHELGWAHSIEVFDRSGRLAGGLYGVRIEGFFSGESMFHLERDASKVALMGLVDLMQSTGDDIARRAVVYQARSIAWCHRHLAERLSLAPRARCNIRSERATC